MGKVTIRLTNGVQATIVGRVWSSPDKGLQRLLQGLEPADVAWGAEPFPELTIAQYVADLLGADITKKEPPEYVKGREY